MATRTELNGTLDEMVQKNENTIMNGIVDDSPQSHHEMEKDSFRIKWKGLSPEELTSSYNDWASNYDWDLRPGIYNGPEMIAKLVAEYYPPNVRKTKRILDVAAGTGRVGEELKKHGFKLVDGLDPSEKMLDIAKQRNIYNHYHLESLGKQQTKIKNDIYDCLTSCGAMAEGHIPSTALMEMIRIVQPGGTIFIMMREEYLWDVNEYNGKLEPLMEDLEKKQFWQQISRLQVPNFCYEKSGMAFIYKVL